MQHDAGTDEGAPGLWSIFRQRALQLGSMGRRQRLVTALAIVQLTACAILLALRGLHMETVPLLGGRSGPTTIPAPILWTAVAFVALAWGYLLAGALHGHPALGGLTLLAFGFSLIPLGQDIGWHSLPGLVRIAALAGIGIVAIASWSRRRAHRTDARGLDASRLALLVGMVGVVYATFVWDASTHAIFRLFTFGFADQLMSISFFLLPMLLLTGAEFSEWAELTGDRGAYLAQRIGSLRLVVGVTTVVSVAVLAHVVISYGAQIPTQILLFAGGALLIAWVARRARPRAGWPRSLPWAALALTAFAFIGILLAEVYRTTELPPETSAAARHAVGGALRSYEHLQDPEFGLSLPESWDVRPLQPGGPGQRSLIAFSGTSGSRDPAQFFVMSVPTSALHGGARLLPVLLARLHPKLTPRTVALEQQRGWRTTEFKLGARLTGLAREKPIGRVEWLLLGVVNRRELVARRAIFDRIWRSFSATGPADAVSSLADIHQIAHRRLDPYRYDPVLVIPVLAWLAVTVLVGVGLRTLRRRLRPAVALGAVFVFAFGVLFMLSELRQVLEEVVHGPVGPLYSVRVPGIQAAIAIATLAFLGVMLARGRLAREQRGFATALLALGVGLQLLVWIAGLYETAASVGVRLSTAQGIVILLALLWELTMSGETVTNGHSRAFPRATRVLMFCGYIMLVATAVLFFSAWRIQTTGLSVEPQFESEGWPALGIVQLGVPALLFVIALRLGVFTSLRRPRRSGEVPLDRRPTSTVAPAPDPEAPERGSETAGALGSDS